MSIKPQPYRVTWPLTAGQAENIDEMFELLFKGVKAVEDLAKAIPTSITGATGAAGPPGPSDMIIDISPISGGGIPGFINFPSLTQGSVLFGGPSGQIAQDNSKFYWDDTNFCLAIRTSSPTSTNAIDIIDTLAGPLGFRVKNLSTSGGNVHASLFVENSSSYGQLFKAGTGYTGYKNIQASDLGFFNITAGNMSTLNDFGNINFAANGESAAGFTIIGPTAGVNGYVYTSSTARFGAGVTAPSAYAHLHAGSTVAQTAPLKFNTGALLTAPEAGAVEFLTDAWYGTITTGTARKQFAFTTDIVGNHNLTGTANQVILSASGTNSLLGSNDITLTLPQSIATSSSVQFGKVGIGVAPTRFLDILGTTEQIRSAYDASNYWSATTDTTGATVLAGVGSITNGIAFQFSAPSVTTGSVVNVIGSGITSGQTVLIQHTGTVAISGSGALVVTETGNTSNNAVTTYAGQFSNTRINGTSGTNIAMYLSATGAATANYGLIVNAGLVGIAMTNPTRALDVTGTFGATGAATFGSTLDTAGSINATKSTNAGLLAGVTNSNSGTGAYASQEVNAQHASIVYRQYSNGFNAFTHFGETLANAGELAQFAADATGPSKFLIGTDSNVAMKFATNNTIYMTLNAAGTLALVSKVATYNNIATAGWGVPAIQASARSTAQTAAVASVATYTVGASDGSFLVAANVLITTSAAYSFTVTVTYTDEANTARTANFQFSDQNNSSIVVTITTGLGGAVPFQGLPMLIRCKASTAITIATTGTFTTVTYNVEGLITQVA